jgi:ketosteroid isomerase-like protein
VTGNETFVLARDGGRWALAALRTFEAEVSADVANGVRAARERFIDAWRKNDAAGAAAVFAADAINMVPGAADSRGRAEIERAFGEFLGGNTIEQVEFTPQEVDVRAYVAYERGTFVL